MTAAVVSVVQQLLRYVGSSWSRAGILAFLGTWGLLLEVVYRHQDALVARL